MEYPLTLTFKIVALAPQITVTDANGRVVCYVKQKLFKLKEVVNVFADTGRTQKICEIKADRIIDFSANYHFVSAGDGSQFGAVRRKGMRSLFKAHYQVLDGEGGVMDVHEENAWVKVGDGCLSSIPVVGLFAGYFLNPSYVVVPAGGDAPVIRVKKQPAFWEGRFLIEQMAPLDEASQLRTLMAILMMVLLERQRG